MTNEEASRMSWAFATNAGSYLRFITVFLQAKFGAQLWIAKDVSDDLQLSDIDTSLINFADVDWPHHRLEVYFEDKALPTLLVARFTNNTHSAEIQAAMPGAKVTYTGGSIKMDDLLIHVQAEDTTSALASATHTPEQIDAFAGGGALASSPQLDGFTSALDASETEELRRMTVLLYKVLLLAGSEGHTVRHTMDKPTKAQGGKPGFKNRPHRPRLIVEYLPRHRNEKQRESAATRKHNFLGRRGHWRKFRSEKFTRLKGQIKYIYPIPGPDGQTPKRKFILLKP